MALTDMVIMPGADYQDACDAVREKTGGTEAIKSGDLGAQIRAIESGGGASLETCTVTINSFSTVDFVVASTASDGEVTGYYYISDFSGNVVYTHIIENVICGSFIGIYSAVPAPIVSVTNGTESVRFASGYFVIKASLEAGTNSTVTISSNM